MASIRNDLPTLEQVLARKTQPPVCLYNLYIIMRDRLHMEEVLDFYLDVQHHQLLWRRYVKSMRRSGYLTEEDLVDGFQSPRVVSRLSQVGSLDEKKSPLSSTTTLDKQQQQHQRGRLQIPVAGGGRVEEDLQSEDMSVPLERPPLVGEDGGEGDDEPSNYNTNTNRMREKAMLNRRDLTDSAHRILMKYLVPAASKELTQLPPELKHTMRREIEQGGRDDPLVFQDTKDYLFEYMRRTAYPKFLRLKVWGNLTLWQQLGRLVVGLVSLLAAFATAFSLIFLDYPQWGTRFWVLLPFWIGVLNVLCFLTGLDPLWVLLFNVSETTTFHFNRIRQAPVKRILWSRSAWLLALSIIIAVVLTIIFAAVPSHRL
ncbi:regulator of g-protein signaling domain-containing protein [Lichtheimia corymbifera JMRC:FSU:9682]|uniref:Regulator of g-protein signaling domain-containing protein n=1 Tax=Lichtheimia corymbifera JMRC:FSU:9682 TaxID=1263082 RepID=A0A068S2S1_9FUNG|nr:regulator of g-protein signaling domain-containing protein [Lichtheimia corymbifera JMRC:FSU:9682]